MIILAKAGLVEQNTTQNTTKHQKNIINNSKTKQASTTYTFWYTVSRSVRIIPLYCFQKNVPLTKLRFTFKRIVLLSTGVCFELS